MPDTRYLYLLIISSFSCFLPSSPPAENGCKSTTIFQTDKIFFAKNFIFSATTLEISTNNMKKKYQTPLEAEFFLAMETPKIGKNRPFQDKKPEKSEKIKISN